MRQAKKMGWERRRASDSEWAVLGTVTSRVHARANAHAITLTQRTCVLVALLAAGRVARGAQVLRAAKEGLFVALRTACVAGDLRGLGLLASFVEVAVMLEYGLVHRPAAREAVVKVDSVAGLHVDLGRPIVWRQCGPAGEDEHSSSVA